VESKPLWEQTTSVESEQNPGSREGGILVTGMSTIWKPLFGEEEGDDDSTATSGGWQGGGYPTRMKPPCQFSHPAFTGKRMPVHSAYDS